MSENIRLTKRDHLVFEQVAEFELTTKKALWRSFFENQRMVAVDSMLRRLDERGIGYLHASKIPGTRTLYYRLTEKGARELGYQFNPKPPSITAICKRMATLYFMNCGPSSQTRKYLDKAALAQFINCEGLHTGKFRPPRVDFYIARNNIEDQQDSSLVLGGILPDLNTSVERAVQRCVKHSKNFIERGWFVDVMRAGRFEWSILTGHKKKQAELAHTIKRALEQRMGLLYFKHGLDSRKLPPIQVRVEVIAELAAIRLRKKKKDKD